MSSKKSFSLDGLNRLKDLTSLDRMAQEHQIILLTVDQIEVKPQVRKDFKDIEQLAENFQIEGQQSPIIVGPIDPDTQKYHLQKGGRRLAAAALIPDFKIKAIVDATVRNRSTAIISQLNENEQRQNLNPYEVALALAEAKAESIREGAPLSNQDLARLASKSETYISVHLGLAELPEELIDLIKNEITTDTEVLRDMKQLRNLQPETYSAFIERANQEGSISRQQVRDAVRLAKGKPVNKKPETQNTNAQAGKGSSSQIPAGGAQATGGNEPQIPHAELNPEPQTGKEPAAPQQPATTPLVATTPNAQQPDGQQPQGPETKPNSAAKKNGKGYTAVTADRIVIGIRVALDSAVSTGYMMNDRISDDPSKAWVMIMVGATQQAKLVKVDQIDIVSVAAMAPNQ
ncbi:ParB/RepB/Spo0J family partition protein [Pseudomonas sp. V1]|uniref:ParB/RepB/Spo0J family partition protein n=1 Tax=Pseudomonas arcuscaelestis TaxID=2710591 RepID=UPI00193FC172|nr:ParB/RepB/Spo0J family partition protein [Pseudomonas arcuscaelestis]MBM3105693.1 ParB/RepB/Spo0J family partition protein [Pseudomonas arcuscaelestis]